MKKLIIILSFIPVFYLNANTETSNTLLIQMSEPIRPFEKIWDAVCEVESDNGKYLYNAKEQATGIVQIRPIRLKDYNQRTHSSYKLVDCYKVEVSKEIFMYYATKFNYNDHEKIAKDWNKSKTNIYWNKVKKVI